MNNKFFLEAHNMKIAIPSTAANASLVAGARVNMQNHERVTIAVFVGTGVGADIKVAFQEHTQETGGTSQALAIANKYFVKADVATVFTQIEPDPISGKLATYDVAALDAVAGVVVFEVLASDLTKNSGFKYISVDIPAPGAAKTVSALYITGEDKSLPPYAVSI